MVVVALSAAIVGLAFAMATDTVHLGNRREVADGQRAVVAYERFLIADGLAHVVAAQTVSQMRLQGVRSVRKLREIPDGWIAIKRSPIHLERRIGQLIHRMTGRAQTDSGRRKRSFEERGCGLSRVTVNC